VLVHKRRGEKFIFIYIITERGGGIAATRGSCSPWRRPPALHKVTPPPRTPTGRHSHTRAEPAATARAPAGPRARGSRSHGRGERGRRRFRFLPRSPPASGKARRRPDGFCCVALCSQEAKKEESEKPKEAAPAEEKPKDAPPAEEKPKEGAGEEKPKEGAGEEKKEEAPPPPPPPPEEVEMRVYMHCEGCARKVKKILRRFDGNAAMPGRISVSLTSLCLCWPSSLPFSSGFSVFALDSANVLAISEVTAVAFF
jgi:hypothetical protein